MLLGLWWLRCVWISWWRRNSGHHPNGSIGRWLFWHEPGMDFGDSGRAAARVDGPPTRDWGVSAVTQGVDMGGLRTLGYLGIIPQSRRPNRAGRLAVN